jgi:hypothetical protein
MQTGISERINYFNSSWESNFFGFLGQHSHMKTLGILGALFSFAWLILSDTFRDVMRGRVSESVRSWFVLERDPRGLAFRDNEVTYGESLPSVGTGEMPPGDSRPYEFMLVMLLAAIDKVEA